MKLKVFSILYTVIVALELYFGSSTSLEVFRHISKPSILIALIIFFIVNTNNVPKTIKIPVLLALIFSLLGDVLLLFVQKNEFFFILGLIAFLIAHIMYSIAFFRERDPKKSPYVFGVLLIGYASVLFYQIQSSLGTMLLPVTAYMIVILSMAICAYLRKGNIKAIGYYFVFVGAVLFMISDSLLASYRHTKKIQIIM